MDLRLYRKESWIQRLGLGSILYYEIGNGFRVPVYILALSKDFGDKKKNRTKIDLAIRTAISKYSEFFSPISLSCNLLIKTNLCGSKFIYGADNASILDITSFNYAVGSNYIVLEKLEEGIYSVKINDAYPVNCTCFSDLQERFKMVNAGWFRKEKLFPELMYLRILPENELMFVFSYAKIKRQNNGST